MYKNIVLFGLCFRVAKRSIRKYEVHDSRVHKIIQLFTFGPAGPGAPGGPV